MPTDLSRAVETVIRRCLAVQPGEEVVIVGDRSTADIAAALRDEAERAGADATLALTTARDVDGAEPPDAIAAALAASDVFIAPTAWSISHTQARKRASEAGARGATMPHVTADMLSRLMAADFDLMGGRSRAIARLLTEADSAHVTCPRGTDLTLDLTGRSGIGDDGDLSAPGAFGNLPCGEGFIAPAGGDGVLVASSLAAIGLADPPARLTVERGRLASVEGAEGELLWQKLTAAGELGTNLAELGVGTNERAGLTGNVLEDEKMLGTVHVAFGASAAIGGTVAVPVHLDVVVLDATLTIGSTTVLQAGELVL
ncbi:MAG: Leucyl aminopeptidase (aminopeptidase T)-like protein [Solirubrobacterales bacterium]|nr:Leucyl aminopeptidase (aminopeptidase T)-like protein [Solirubrobacterales bacterium]